VVSAEWGNGCWLLTTRTGETRQADVVIAATGFLHRKKMPAIEGPGVFQGSQFHSSEWPDDLDVSGKQVAVVGSGSSGIQMVCALSEPELHCQVTQYVRSPQWIETIKNPEAGPTRRVIGRLFPKLGQHLQARLMEGIEQDPRLRDPSWKLDPGPKREAAQQAFHDFIAVIRDAELRGALTPDFPPGCKRIPKSPTYYQAVQRPNVRIVRRGVSNLVPQGIREPDGTVNEYDVIVWATGFETHAYVRPMQVVGLDGTTLDEIWGDDDVFSYRGVAVPDFPNFFILNGPFSPVNNVTIPRTVNDEMDWICEVLAEIVDKGCAFAPSRAATEDFVSWVSDAIPRTVWADGCTSWYRGAKGFPIIWPWYDREQTEMFADVGIDRLDPVPCRLAPIGQP
jgi:cation diffusion facilitator CzcD-associated flavoprotein CzcO